MAIEFIDKMPILNKPDFLIKLLDELNSGNFLKEDADFLLNYFNIAGNLADKIIFQHQKYYDYSKIVNALLKYKKWGEDEKNTIKYLNIIENNIKNMKNLLPEDSQEVLYFFFFKPIIEQIVNWKGNKRKYLNVVKGFVDKLNSKIIHNLVSEAIERALVKLERNEKRGRFKYYK